MNYKISKRFALFCMFTALTVASCSYGERLQKGQAATPDEAFIRPVQRAEFPILIKSSVVYCWWWPESIVLDPKFNADYPPPKTKYVELTEWRYDGERLTTAPHTIDLVATALNPTNTTFKGRVKFRLYSRFEELIYISDSQTSPSDIKKCEDCPWIDELVLLDKDLVIESGKESIIEFKEYDLTQLLNKKKGNKALCAFSFVVEIANSSENVLQKERIIPVALGD